jgi:Na+/proline symporter/signal transduction histidine kinase/CheY-like chemotaxis protein
MFNPLTVITVFCLYVGLLFLIALYVERKSAVGRDIGNNPLIYSLSLAVYCTTWTYYGSVGKAATSGMLFLTIYLGPTIVIILWWLVIRKIIRIKNAYRITSIADFISARYNKSQSIAAITTIIALAGIIPYVALQLKAVISTFEIITNPVYTGSAHDSGMHVGPIVVVLMTVFTIIFGARRLDPTERHQGMVVALAVECIVKLIAFLAAGIFVTYFLFDGFSDIFQRLSDNPFNGSIDIGESARFSYMTWTTYLILAMSAIMFLPRQFHVTVVENFDEKHLRTAMWLFPLYLFLINIFVFPIAKAGLLMGFPAHEADTFVLDLPLHSGQKWLSLLVFIGGFSAATGMIMISSMTMATMITNHLLLPVINWVKWLGFLKRHLLQCRWIALAGYILAGYWFERNVGVSFMLVDLGMISFAAVLQFAPAVLGGIFWQQGNRKGALLGLSAGFLIWFYTLVVPTFVTSGWISNELLENGPWGIEFLRPEHLLGMTGLDPLSHAVFWTMLFNIGLYVIGSLYFEQGKEEQNLSKEFVNAIAIGTVSARTVSGGAFIDIGNKRRKIEELLGQYFPETKAAEITNQCLSTLKIAEKKQMSIVELAELLNEVEKYLSGSIGAAAAHHAIHSGTVFTPEEERELSNVYAEILAGLKLPPSDLKEKIDYYQEREVLLTQQAIELGKKIEERDREIAERKRLEEQLRQSQKMEAIGTLAGGVAHDFNNILTAIIGYGNLLKMQIKEDDPLANYIDQILSSSERAANLTQSLLAFSRKQMISPRPVNLNDIVRRVEKLLQMVIGEDIELKTELSSGDLIVMADSSQIEQVLMNLSTNAKDAMPHGGILKIKTARAELGMKFLSTHEYIKPGIYALISVSDTGTGMDEKTKQRIFEPFFTTKEVGKGTGLGLSMVYGIIKQHNGEISVNSELGKGTTFNIYLPLVKSEIKKTRFVSLTAPKGGTETLLIAEDDREVRKLTKDVLEAYGYKVIEAADGEDAVNQFFIHKDEIRLLLLDVIMPKKNGREVYEKVKQMKPDIRVLFTSGYTADTIHRTGVLEEGLNFVAKPLSPNELLKKIREVLEK